MQGTYEELISRAKAGDGNAYAEVVRRFQEKSTQEAFLSAYLELMKLREPKAFPGWLRRIVSNAAMDVLRDHRGRTRGLSEAELEIVSPKEGPAARADRREVERAVRRAIDALPANEAQIARPYFLGEEKLTAIAAELGITEEAARSRLRRARVRLQQSLVGLADRGRKHDMKANAIIRQAATEEAVEQFRAERLKLIESNLQDQTRLADLYCAEGRMLRFLGKSEEAIKLFTEGLRGMQRAKDAPAQARMRTEIGLSQLMLARYPQAERTLTAAGASAGAAGADDAPGRHAADLLAAVISNGLGTCAWGRGDHARARELWDRAVGESRRAHYDDLAAAALNNVSLIDWKRGDLAGALAGFKACRAKWQKIGNRHGLAQTLVNVGILEENLGRLSAAQASYRKALALAKDLKFAQLEAIIYGNLANLALAREDWQGALTHAQEAQQRARGAKDDRSEAIALENAALAWIGLARKAPACTDTAREASEARRALEQARGIAKRIGDHERLFSLDLVEVECLLAAGEAQTALAMFRALEKILTRGGYAGERGRLLRLWAEAEHASGRPGPARRRASQALEVCRTQGNQSEARRVLAVQKAIEAGGTKQRDGQARRQRKGTA